MTQLTVIEEQIAVILVEGALQKRTVTFKEIMTRLKISRRKLGEYLKHIGEKCKELGLPIITSIVVYTANNKVGSGYVIFETGFAYSPDLAEKEQQKVWENTDWSKLVTIVLEPDSMWVNDIITEGAKKTATIHTAVRNAALRNEVLRQKGRKCVVCGFDGDKVYGKPMGNIIQVHHLNPIANGERNTTIDDLVPVCPNCHAAIHSKPGGMYTIAEVQEMLKHK